MMHNCVKLFVNERLFAIVENEGKATFLLRLLDEGGSVYSFRIVHSYIDGVGF